MSRDVTDVIDQYCESILGHTNWAWISTMSKEALMRNIDDEKGFGEGDVFFFYAESEEE